MKNRLFVTMVASALVVTGCNNDDFGTTSRSQENVIAVLPSANGSSRTTLNESRQVVWSDGDAISIFVGENGSSPFTNYQVALVSGAGTTEATFNLILPGENPQKMAAVYPYNENTVYAENGTITLSMQNSYTYQENDISGAPMAAKFSGQNSRIEFKNAGALLVLTVKNIPAGYNQAVLTATGSQALSGPCKIEFGTDDAPTLTTTSTTITEDIKKIVVNFNSSNELTNKTFYFPLPVANFQDLKFSIEGTGTPIVLQTKALNVERNQRYKNTFTLETITGVIPTEVNGAEAANTALVSTNNLNVTIPSTETSSTITLPAATTTNNSTQSTTLSFEPLTASQTVTINATADVTVSENVNVSASASTDEGANNFVINLPNSTVTLDTNDDNTTYNNVTAHTASNTLKVQKGVTIKNLTIKGGNVRVSGQIDAISCSEDNVDDKTYIIQEDGCQIPDVSGNDKYIVISAAEYDLRQTAAKGGEIAMSSDLVLQEPLVVKGEMVLDLNGHSLKADPAGLATIYNTHDAVVLVRRGAKLTVNDSSNGQGSIDANNVSSVLCGIKITDSESENDNDLKDKAAELIVNGGQIIGYEYGISGNGKRDNTKITVNGGYIQAPNNIEDATAIYQPQSGTLTVTGGNLVGYNSAIEVRSGTLNITGGTFETKITKSTDFNKAANGDGTTIKGAAIAISQHSTNKDINVTIEGGTFIAGNYTYALYEEDLQDESSNNISVSVTGGEFTGKIFSENCKECVKGGTFTEPSALEYLGTESTPTLKFNRNIINPNTAIEIKKGHPTINLNGYKLKTNKTVTGTSQNGAVAIAVHDGAKVKVQNGTIGSITNQFYGIYAFGTAEVEIEKVTFTNMVTYAYNGAGTLKATDCVFQGWLSGWGGNSAQFENCTFTYGKAYWPAVICYGNTTFNGCKFFKNGVDADVQKVQSPNNYTCNYVVAGCNPTTTIGFTNCKFIDTQNVESDITASDHPYHACKWGDGQVADANVTVDGQAVTSQCTSKQQETATGN